MKKLFISQPMNGKTDEEILAVRHKAIESAERNLGEKVEVIDSFFKGAPVDAKPLWFSVKAWSFLQRLMLLILQKVGTLPVVVKSSIPVLLNMVQRPSLKIIHKERGVLNEH